ncbi:hypothetical protein GEMRC1_012870 [Eukaryota sp. GEM-RC1]
MISVSKTVQLQQTLLDFISFHLLEHILNLPLKVDHDNPRHHLHSITETLSIFFSKVGFISDRFFDSAFTAVQVFFNTHTFPIVSSDIALLSSLSSFFASDLRPFFLIARGSIEDDHIKGRTPLIHGLYLHVYGWQHFTLQFLDPTYYRNLGYLKRLDVNMSSASSFDFFCQSFLNSTNVIEELNISNCHYRPSLISSLAEILQSHVSSLRYLSFSQYQYKECKMTVKDECLRPIIPTIMLKTPGNTSQFNQMVDLSGIFGEEISAIEPVLNVSTVQSIILPRIKLLNSDFFSILKYKFHLQELVFIDNYFNAEDLAELITVNTFLKNLELRNCSLSLSPLFKSLPSNSSLQELIIQHDKEHTDDEVSSLVELIRTNTNLLVLTLGGLLFNSDQLKLILQALEQNSTLKKTVYATVEIDSDLFHDGF